MMTRFLLLLLPLSCALQGQDSLNVFKLFHWDDPSLPGSAQYDNTYNEVYGYAAGGREYAIIGSTMGTHFFDVTDPVNSTLVDFVPGANQGPVVIHRDFKTYAGYLYAVCDEGQSTLQIIDLHYLPDSVHLAYNSNDLFVRAHNIQLDTANARLYTCGGSSPFSIWSLADPVDPTLLLDCADDITWWDAAVGYVHDCFVRDNIAWCNDEDGLHVVDFTNLASPQLLASLTTYPEPGYNHSGWMNDAGTVYAMADETHGTRIKLIDATDLADLQVLGFAGSGVHPLSIVHNPFFRGSILHAAYYYDGYWLWNTQDPGNPVLLGYYDTSTIPNGPSYKGAWGVYPWLPSGIVLVSDMQTGLWVLDISPAVGSSDPGQVTDPFRVWPTVTSGPIQVAALDGSVAEIAIEVLNAAGMVLLNGQMDPCASTFQPRPMVSISYERSPTSGATPNG